MLVEELISTEVCHLKRVKVSEVHYNCCLSAQGVGSQNGALQLSKPGKHDITKALELTGDGPSCVGARRPQRVRKENTWYAGGNYQSTLSAEYDWVIFYPDTPYDSNTQVIDALGNVVSITGQLECRQQGNSALGEVITFSSGSSESLADAAWVPRTSRKDRKESPQVSEIFEDSSIGINSFHS